ncbi:hypothetical protein C0993_001045 [Termitomyces sp. T159_Od127]|nr:hypothetical protein C0993_001045 [Termitomyces sp. T159_Od127]
MKRAISAEVSPAKRIKLSHDIFEDSQQRNPLEILESGLEDDSGYISCKCFMTWRPTTKHKAILETTEFRPPFRFDVEFAGACIDFFPEIELKAQDQFLLALKSAQVEKSSKQSRLCTIPLKLVYEEGVIIKFLKRQGPCRIVDTWQLREDARRQEDSWFLPPPSNSLVVKDVQPVNVNHPNQVSCVAPSTGITFPASKILSTSSTATLDNDKANSSHIPISEARNPKLSKREIKRLKERRRALMLASESAKDTITTVVAPDLRPSSVPQIVASALPLPQPPSHKDAAPHTITTSMARSSRQSTAAGLLTTTGKYHEIASLNDLAHSAWFNVIGVVVQVSPPGITRRGDWYCNVQIVDPSNTQVEDLNGFGGFRVNCFTRKYAQWLPHPSPGEVLIMRDLKISIYNGIMGVGHYNRLQWAIFSPSTGKIRHCDVGDAPESEGLQEGFGYSFTPFFKPEETEIRYCSKLADWWAEVEKKRNSIAEIHQVCGPSDVISHSRPRRQHRLISEAGPHVSPDGYFDCTVEVLHGHLNDNGVYSLYVTDYTANTGVPPTEASWCPPDLADYVLKIEAWDDAVEIAQSMSAGEFYSIKNARMVISNANYVEGKVVQKKIQWLDAETDGNVNPYFKALLERKEAWKDAHRVEDRPDFEYKTIGEAVEKKHFHCVVEVLRVIYDDKSTSCIYVTDYTSRNELVSGRVQSSWGAGLDGSILRIALFNDQAEVAKTIQAGAFYDIQKLRLKQSPTTRQFQGQLGGAERLISLLDPKLSNDRLSALQRRKEEWQKSLKSVDTLITTNFSVKTGSNQKDATQAAHLPPLQKACFDCDDTDHEYVRFMFQMYFLLEDADGNRIYVSVHDGSSVFDGLKRGDISKNSAAYEMLSDRLSSLLGNLLELHSAHVPKEGTEILLPNTPMMSLIIDTWEVDGKYAYCLAGCDELKKQ